MFCYIVCSSVLSCSNLKLHQSLEVKNIFQQEKIMLQLAFNPGLTLTGFRTTRPSKHPSLSQGRLVEILRREGGGGGRGLAKMKIHRRG